MLGTGYASPAPKAGTQRAGKREADAVRKKEGLSRRLYIAKPLLIFYVVVNERRGFATMAMTLDEFFDLLKTKRGLGWKLEGRRAVRDGNGRGPIQACRASASLDADGYRSVLAASDGTAKADPVIRARLLGALGLAEDLP